MNLSSRSAIQQWGSINLLYLLFAFLITSMLSVNNAQGQVLSCGVYIKPPSGTPPTGPLYTDRFGNTYSQQELTDMYQNASPLQCMNNTGEFNLVIQSTNYMGTTYPTPDQELVICNVFQYLSGLISAPGSGGAVNIPIIFDPALVGSGKGGTGSPLFASNCGIGYSLIQEQLNTQNPNYPVSFPHGTIRINPEANWYTGSDPNAIPNNQVDLYTAVLHEALHVMGFASQIGATGSSLNGFYTLHDLNLQNVSGNKMIIAANGTGDCCQDYHFNTIAFPNMPTPILTCGNVRYDVSQSPPVHGNYGVMNPDDATTANILSHLNIICGDEDYVMHSHITAGFISTYDGTDNVRRWLTPTELEVMCQLGYDMTPTCNASCFVIVGDDGSFVLNEALEIIPYALLFANDFDAEGNYDIDFDFSCGSTGSMVFTPKRLF